MKRLTIIIVLMLSVCQLAIAQQERTELSGEFQLTATKLFRIPLIGWKRYGNARFTYQPDGDINVHVYIYESLKDSSFYLNDKAAIQVDSGRVSLVEYTLTDSGRRIWKMDYQQQMINYISEEGESDNMRLVDNSPKDALCAILDVLYQQKLGVGDTLTLPFYGASKGKITRYSVEIIVDRIEKVKVNGSVHSCLKLKINLLGGKFDLGGKKSIKGLTLWVKQESQQPVKVESVIYFVGISLGNKIRGVLIE